MPPGAGELRREKDAHDVLGQLRPDHPRPQAEDVHVVVFDSLTGGEGIVAHGGTDAGHFVGGDRGPDTAPAEHHTTVGVAPAHRFAEGAGVVRIVNGDGVVRAEVDDLVAEWNDLLAAVAPRV